MTTDAGMDIHEPEGLETKGPLQSQSQSQFETEATSPLRSDSLNASVSSFVSTSFPVRTDKDKEEDKNKEEDKEEEEVLVVTVTRPNPFTDILICLVPLPRTKDVFVVQSSNSNDSSNDSNDNSHNTVLHKIVCDYMEDVWSAACGEDRLSIYRNICAKVRFLVPQQSQSLQSQSQSQQQQAPRFRKPNRRLPLFLQQVQQQAGLVRTINTGGTTASTDTDTDTDTTATTTTASTTSTTYRVLWNAEQDIRVHSFLEKAFGLEETSATASDDLSISYKAPKETPRRASDGTYNRPRGRPLLGYDWNCELGLWSKSSSDSNDSDSDKNENDGDKNEKYVHDSFLDNMDTTSVDSSNNGGGDCSDDDDSFMDGTDGTSGHNNNSNHKKEEEEKHILRRTSTRRSTSSSKCSKSQTLASDINMAADISQVAVLLADLHESESQESVPTPTLVDNDHKNKNKNDKNKTVLGEVSVTATVTDRTTLASDQEPADDLHGVRPRPVVVAKPPRKKTAVAPKIQVGQLLLPKIPCRFSPNGTTYVRPRGRAPLGYAWDEIRGVWVYTGAVTPTSATTITTTISTAPNKRNSNVDSGNDSSRTCTLNSNDDVHDNDSLDDASADYDYDDDSFIDNDNSSDNNIEDRGMWVMPPAAASSLPWKPETAIPNGSSSQPSMDGLYKLGEKYKVIGNANANCYNKENMKGPVLPRQREMRPENTFLSGTGSNRPASRAATNTGTNYVAAVDSSKKASVEESFLAYRSTHHPRRHQYSTERSSIFAPAAAAAVNVKKRREPASQVYLARHNNQDKRRRQNSHELVTTESSFTESSSDQHQGEIPNALSMAPRDIPNVVVSSAEYSRHGVSRFERSTDAGLPGGIASAPGPFGGQPNMGIGPIENIVNHPPGPSFCNMQHLIQEIVRINTMTIEQAWSSTNMALVQCAAPLPTLNELCANLHSAPWSCVLRRRLAEASCPHTRARLQAALSRVERAEPYLIQFLRCLHHDG